MLSNSAFEANDPSLARQNRCDNLRPENLSPLTLLGHEKLGFDIAFCRTINDFKTRAQVIEQRYVPNLFIADIIKPQCEFDDVTGERVFGRCDFYNTQVGLAFWFFNQHGFGGGYAGSD